MLTVLTNDKLTTVPTVRHGFFGRQGGISEGLYASLNCGFGAQDNPDNVKENRARVGTELDLAQGRLVSVYQAHTANVVTVTQPWDREEAPQADGMVTREPGLGLGVLAADCAPVLFADAGEPVIGAAHSGWKGAIGGILEATIEAMENLGADRARIRAVIGPCISVDAYEVGAEFYDRFATDDKRNTKFFRKGLRPDHWQFDLPKYVLSRLKRAGIEHPTAVDQCTYFNETKFFSYRRSTHRAEQDYGRNLSVISLQGT